MRNISNERFVATKVLIQFEDGPLSLGIPRGATLGDVSEKLHNICKVSIRGRPPCANGSDRAFYLQESAIWR